MLSVREALDRLLAAATPIARRERIAAWDGSGRVLVSAIESPVNVPPMRNAQMDGYAVRAGELARASGTAPIALPVSQRIPAGIEPVALVPGTAARIFTGAMLPDGADAIVAQEDATVQGEHVAFARAPAPGEWVREAGEDIRAGTTIVDAGTRLTPQACGLVASVGIGELEVTARPRVAVFFTGDELRMPGEPLPPGAIYNSNRFSLRGLLAGLGCEVDDLGIVRDDREATVEALQRAAIDHDLVLTCGGVSVGEEDHVRAAVERIGAIDLWQIGMKPGKPLALGRIGADATPFIGLPGNPVSAVVTFMLFVRPFILRRMGAIDVEPRRLRMVAGFDWPRPDKRHEFLRARVGDDGRLILFPTQASHVLTSTVWADGLVDNPPSQAIAAGDLVDFIAMAELLS